MDLAQRKNVRLAGYDYSSAGGYFVTICTASRRRLFANPAVVEETIAVLRERSTALCFLVYAFCFMPDHLHLVLIAQQEASDLVRFVREFKGAAAARLRPLGVRNLWQKSYYDHVLRSGEALDSVAWYIFNNPLRAGLVRNIGEWPFSGSWMFDWNKVVAPTRPFEPPWKKTKAGRSVL